MSNRKAQLVAAIEARLCASEDPLHVRIKDGRTQVGHETWFGVLWVEVESLSRFLLARGHGLKSQDDGIPF